jgi:hypothetical protein
VGPSCKEVPLVKPPAFEERMIALAKMEDFAMKEALKTAAMLIAVIGIAIGVGAPRGCGGCGIKTKAACEQSGYQWDQAARKCR